MLQNNYPGYFNIGYLQKTFGYKGELVSIIERVDSPEEFLNLESVFILIDNQPVPFLFEYIEERTQNSFVVKFEDIDDIDKARKLVGCSIIISDNEINIFLKKRNSPFLLIGYEVIDKKFGSLGKIQNILELPQQILIQLNYKNKELLIPLVDQIVNNIDNKKKVISILAPSGLINQ